MMNYLPEGDYQMYVHEEGDVSNGCKETGPDFNPKSVRS